VAGHDVRGLRLPHTRPLLETIAEKARLYGQILNNPAGFPRISDKVRAAALCPIQAYA
jgi:hypothetical protein